MSFDYKGFAKDIKKQAEEIIPEDIALQHKKDFLEKIYNYTYVAGEAFSNDDSIGDESTAKVLTQIISEWTFHKYIDLLRSDIPQMYHESILQKLAFVAFEMTKEGAKSNLTQDEMLKLVELQLKKAYEKSCKHLLDNGQITESAYEKALNLSNVDDMSKNLCHNIKIVKRKSTFKYTTAALFFSLFTLCLNIFMPQWEFIQAFNTFAVVILSMYVGFYIGRKSS